MRQPYPAIAGINTFYKFLVGIGERVLHPCLSVISGAVVIHRLITIGIEQEDGGIAKEKHLIAIVPIIGPVDGGGTIDIKAMTAP